MAEITPEKLRKLADAADNLLVDMDDPEDVAITWAAHAALRAAADEIERLRSLLQPVANLYGTKTPHVVIGRTVRDAYFALTPKA